MKAQYGYTLLELTLGMSIAIVAISQTLSLYSEKVATQGHQIAQLRLNQETRAIMGLISNDIRRHGYWQGDTPLDNPHADLFVGENCIILSYDRDKNGSKLPASNEIIAYRLNKGRIQTRNNAANCNDGRWEALNEVETVTIDTFLLSKTERSDCINLSHTPYSNCNLNDCDYQLMKSRAVDVTISAHLTQETKQKINLVNHINLNNPTIETATNDGPTKSTNPTCS